MEMSDDKAYGNGPSRTTPSAEAASQAARPSPYDAEWSRAPDVGGEPGRRRAIEPQISLSGSGRWCALDGCGSKHPGEDRGVAFEFVE